MTSLEDHKDYAKDQEDLGVNVQVQEALPQDDPAQSKWMHFYRSTLCQQLLLGSLSFCGPSMQDSISALGGGGLATPYLANLANSLSYALSAVTTLFGGVIVSQMGVKWACVVGAIGSPLVGSGYYVNSLYGEQIWLLASNCIGGITGGFLYVAESTAMLSYPLPRQRGTFLAIWVGCRNLGSVVGGSVALSQNVTNSGAGAVSIKTYLIFIVFMVIGVPLAMLLSPQEKVRRSNGTSVTTGAKRTIKHEFGMIYAHLKMKRSLLMIVPSAFSFFYGGVFSTYLGLHFSVRARALSSFVTPVCTIFGTACYGLLLDKLPYGQRTRAWVGFLTWLIPTVAACIWLSYENWWFSTQDSTLRIDYTDAAFARTYLPFLVMQVVGYSIQAYMYWLLSTFASDVHSNARAGSLFRTFETVGQSISWGINSHSNGNRWIGLGINFGLMLVGSICIVFVIRMVPEIPLTFDVAEGELDAEESLNGASGQDVLKVEQRTAASFAP